MMKNLTMIATTSFGLEAVAKRELNDLGLKILKTDNGRIYFEGDLYDLARSNVWLRTADRIIIEIGNFEATSFEELFDQVYELPWDQIIPKNGNFVINGKSIKSKLFSVRNCQSITEKAIVEKLKTKYKIDWFEKSGALYDIEVSLYKDQVSISLDSSGPGLHKRGYRPKHGLAPLKETLAAAMVLLSFWNPDRQLYDPFCGTATILIEAALIGKNIAPGLKRSFSFNNWAGIDHKILKEVKEEAISLQKNYKLDMYGTDLNQDVITLANQIIKDMDLDQDIKLYNMDFKDFNIEEKYGIMITNPPYGERFKDVDLKKLARDLSKKFKDLTTWSSYILTSDENFEKKYGKKSDRKRKLYNGRIKVDYYQYYGQRPPG